MAALLAGTLFLTNNALTAQDAAAKARELQAMRAQIQDLQRKLDSGRKKKSDAEKQLHDIERQISSASRVLRGIDSEQAANRRQLEVLQNKQRIESDKLKRQRNQLAKEARAAYAMGRQQQVKLLLNQEQPSAVGRMLVYFGYFSRARTEQIDAMRTTLKELHTLENSIARKTEFLTELRTKQQAESRRLTEKKRKRKQVLARLSRELESQGGELQRLQTDARQLQELVASLQELLADIPADASQQQPFKVRKGKLHWPTRGRVARKFGSQRGSSGLKWQGVMIAAPEGGNVHAVAQGRVAFADWMRGFGLLLIIDHGDGYMSLYGHNQSLYKEVGEWVDTGEMVATLGASGGQTEAGLYFELRHQGRPINPVRWCAGNPDSVPG